MAILTESTEVKTIRSGPRNSTREPGFVKALSGLSQGNRVKECVTKG